MIVQYYCQPLVVHVFWWLDIVIGTFGLVSGTDYVILSHQEVTGTSPMWILLATVHLRVRHWRRSRIILIRGIRNSRYFLWNSPSLLQKEEEEVYREAEKLKIPGKMAKFLNVGISNVPRFNFLSFTTLSPFSFYLAFTLDKVEPRVLRVLVFAWCSLLFLCCCVGVLACCWLLGMKEWRVAKIRIL